MPPMVYLGATASQVASELVLTDERSPAAVRLALVGARRHRGLVGSLPGAPARDRAAARRGGAAARGICEGAGICISKG